MAIFGSSFTYNGKSSDDFGVIICASEQPESISMGLTREILKGEITSRQPVSNWYNTKYSDVLTFEVTITKPENRAFSREEIRDINAWLTGPRTPTLLFFEDEAFDPINYYGVFTDVTNVYGSGILMLTYTFTADSPYGWSNEREFAYNNLENCLLAVNDKNVSVNNKSVEVTIQNAELFEVNNDTDEIGDFTYPLIAIYSYAGTQITIDNYSEISTNDLLSHSLTLTIPNAIDYTNPLYIDSKNHKIYYYSNTKKKNIPVQLSDLGFTSDNLTNLDNGSLGLYWVRLVPGVNKFKITGGCSIKMTFRCPRKVGAY